MPRSLRWTPACIGVGSNLDDPVRQVRLAIDALARIPATRLERVSGLYRNPPMGPADQPPYVNAVALLLTRLSPHDLLDELQSIERRQGRGRVGRARWGPREIDLDILTFASRTIDDDRLRVPHPGISQRNFVLFPLMQLAPQLDVPGLGRLESLAGKLDAAELEPVAGSIPIS